MSRLRRILAVSFRAKVLVPVIAVMVLLMAATAWIVNERITQQVQMQSREALATANDAFRYFQSYRRENLLLHFRDLPGQPFYRAALETKDGPTLRGETFNTLLAQQGVDLVVFTTDEGKAIASTPRDPTMSAAEFENATATIVKQAMRGEEKGDLVAVAGKLYDAVSVPAYDRYGNLIGVLTVGSRITRDALEEPSRLTHSHIVLLADDHVALSTVAAAGLNDRLVHLFRDLSQGAEAEGDWGVRKEDVNGEHFYCSGGRLATASGHGALGYLLLYSYEQPMRALQSTQQILLLVSGLAILFGSILICVLVDKATRPIRELRNSAEAIGRGDFSRRVKIQYDDECGELARAFNQMTENLKNSREQLEMTVETLKTTQRQLVQSEKLSGIGEFIAGVAHELNNPLTSLMGFAELLREAEVSPKYKRHLELINKSALRCQKIVQALLSFARRRSPERKPACLNGVIESAVEIMQYQLRTSNVRLTLELNPQLPATMIDPHQMQQVFVNILNNARQAIEGYLPEGWIKVKTESLDERVRVIIQDSGPGIPEDSLSKIFDPFFTTKDIGKGTGLGLSLCYGIVKEHGGTIVPHSKPGEGATFVIELPVAHQADQATVELPIVETAAEADAGEGRGKKVLVIDDEEPILQMVREALTPNGYEVDVAGDGETGLRQLSRKRYDLTLCDWKMPGLNGEQVYERIRALNPTLCERVIFITGDVVNEKTRRFFEEHNKVCLAKPFTLGEFRAAIKKVLVS
jgi:two-component system NtrC family sensor kinase